MDDTQQSRASDAGATRKRRSSILKIQRPPRTPFSELEFNVATPTDTAKSRRVSFSRRTGVAEFVTNEATTTWKNFYEEHNKSLESSGNDSGAHASRQPIGHLGKRIFEQQFEEVEAVDFITSLDNLAGRNINNTMNINFTEQLASLEATDNMKPTAPHNNFELSALTDHHSKLFADDLAMPTMGEGSGRIDINFSAVQSIDVKDDLDEIQRDIQRQSNVVGPPPFRDARDFSEYIEVELNSTHAAIKTEESDMSITETIPSPKVNVSRTLSPSVKKSSLNWVDDKENKRFDNLDVKANTQIFDVNDMSITTALPTKVSQESAKRKTIVFEDAFADLSMTKPLPVKLMADDNENRRLDSDVKSKSFVGNADMSMTAVIPGKIAQQSEKRRTMIFDDDLGDLSMTRALPAKIIDKEDIRAKSLVFDRNTDMSMTEVLPGKMNQEPEKRRTMIFEDDLGDLSMTKPIPAQLLSVHSEIIDKSILNEFPDNNSLKTNENTTGKRRTILFDDNLGDLSMTKPIPAQMITVHSEMINSSNRNENINKSSSQPIGNTAEKRKTILFDDDLGDLSITKPIVTKMLSAHSEIMNKSYVNDVTNNSIVQSKDSHPEKRKTIVFNNDDGDLSITKPIPASILSVHSEIVNKSSLSVNMSDCSYLEPKVVIKPNESTEKRKTILFDDDLGDLSMTKPIPRNMLAVHSEIMNRSKLKDNFNKSNLQAQVTTDKRKTILFEDNLGDLSITKPISAKLLSTHSDIIERSIRNVNTSFNRSRVQEYSILRDKENMFERDDENVASTSKIIEVEPKEGVTEKRKTILFDDGLGDLSMTKPIPAQLLSVHSEMIDKTINRGSNVSFPTVDVKSQTIVYDNDDRANMSISPTNEVPKETNMSISPTLEIHKETNMPISPTIEHPKETENHKTIFEDNVGNMSISRPIPAELAAITSDVHKPTQDLWNKNNSIRATEKRTSIVFENDTNDILITKPIPTNIIDIQNDEFNKTKEDYNKESELANIDFSKFKAQEVVVYQVATNETSMTKGAEEQICSKDKMEEENKLESSVPSIKENKIEQGDPMTVESSTFMEKDKDIKEINTDDEMVNTDATQDESQQVEKEEDISRHVSIDSVIMNVSVDKKKSLLCDLLDMTHASLTSGIDNKDVSVKMSSEKPAEPETASKTDTAESVASDMFYITRDTDSETQADAVKERKAKSITFFDEESNQKLLSDESVPELIDNVKVALSELKDFNNLSHNLNETEDIGVGVSPERSSESIGIPKYPKSFNEVDNTKELLDMLSDLTEGRPSICNEEVEPIKHLPFPALENKETVEPRRVSIAPNRQSILSREDLLNNISMAQAALQQSIDMEDSDIEEPTPAVVISPPKKTVRVSNEVVKTLHFEDESSASELSVKAELKSPLKKTAFGETSYMKETTKTNVIPSYLKDVSDGIKTLMRDLVKPMADEQPFESVALGKPAKKSPSTCSTQIQANLITSSQIDLDLLSNPESTHEVERERVTNRLSVTLRSPVKSVSFTESDAYVATNLVSRNLKEATFRPKRHTPEPLFPGKVLVFDHENPLNNVLLTPTEYTEVHKYNPPRELNESPTGSERSPTQCSVREREYDVENISIKYDFTNFHTRCPSGDSGADMISKNISLTSSILSKPASIDRCVGVKVTEVKDIEVNTAIAMKKNKDLLEASSSLTLVDDAFEPAFEIDSELAATNSPPKSEANIRSPLRVIYKLKGDALIENVDSDIGSNNEAKPKKRIYSPSSSEKQSTPSNPTTPKPIIKMQRLSDSPNSRNSTLKRLSSNKAAERDASSAESKMEVDVSPKVTPRRKSPKKKGSPKKEAVSITVQQLLTEFNVKPEIDQKMLSKQILEALSKTDSSAAPESLSEGGRRSLEMVSSFTSSKNQCKVRQSTTTTGTESTDSREEWVDKSPVLECDSSVNVVAKIDMLSFMGSHECEWASSGTDSWSFRLLHGRLRLDVRLAHRHHNAARTRVRADTPVTAVTVHQSHHGNDKRNSVAMLCITFAAEAIRAAADGACSRAGDVPALLRRGAAVARRALRWGRAMHDARMHLAYTLSDDGELVLKVANIPLRCVWEVSMKLELCVQPRVLPWPRAARVRVARVLDAAPAPARGLHALLAGVPDGWPHAPATVWRIFKYLKSKTADDDAMGL